MKRDHSISQQGITLIELLVVVMIVGILAAIAVPWYSDYMIRARRTDAKTGLEQLRASQEMFRAERGRYANDANEAPAGALVTLQNTWGVPANPVGDYTIAFTVSTPNAFTAQATPVTPRQGSDGWLSIDQNGTKMDQGGHVYPDRYGKWAR